VIDVATLDASVGYTDADPIGLADGISGYAYVEGDPLGNADPSGLCSTKFNGGTTNPNMCER